MRYLAAHERAARGTFDFPIELYHVDISHPRYEMPFHWHMEAELLFVLEGETEVGFALFFHNFSTFLGRAGLYLEDLYVRPECRGKGYGKALFRKLAQVALERGCGRMEWWCLDWNRPSIDFYTKGMGAEPMSDWTVYRLAGETLKQAANQP